MRGNTETFAFLAVLAILPIVWGSDYELSILTRFCILSTLLIGLNLITGYGRMINLAHAGFYGLGAYTAGVLSAKFMWPTSVGFILAPVGAALLAWVVGIPSLRLRGIYFAMATLGTGMVLFLTFGRAVGITGGPNGLRGIPSLAVGSFQFDTPLSRYLLAATVALMIFWIARRLVVAPFGQALHAAAVSEPAAAVAGVSVQRVRILAFVASAAIAGLAGSVEVFNTRFVSPTSFDFFVAVTFLVGLTLGGSGTILGPIVGAAVLVALAEGLSDQPNLRLLVIGLVFLVVLQVLPDGLVGGAKKIVGSWRRKRETRRPSVSQSSDESLVGPDVDVSPGWLEVSGISKHFGGVEVLKEVSFRVESGKVLGLIGPNGAGKTTLANVISGFVAQDAGRIFLSGIELTSLSPHGRAAVGLGRSFQNLELFPGLSALDNVLMGAYLRRPNSMVDAVVWGKARSDDEERERARALSLMSSFDLSEDVNQDVDNLPFGKAKLVELARIMEMNPRVVILDEPAAGLPSHATGPVRELIASLRNKGVAVVLIEHNVKLVMGISDEVLVLDHGVAIAHGTPEEVQQNPDVITAYLGHHIEDGEPRSAK